MTVTLSGLHETSLEGIQPLFISDENQAMEDALLLIVQSLQSGRNRMVQDGLQQYTKVRGAHIDNPLLYMTDLLRQLADGRLDQLSAVLKKEVLLVVRDLVHHLYVKSQRDKRALVPERHEELTMGAKSRWIFRFGIPFLCLSKPLEVQLQTA